MTTQNSLKCPCRNCPNNSRIQIRLRYFNLIGSVCESCADSLINEGLAIKEEKMTDVSPVRAGHQITHRGGEELHER